MLLEAKHQEVAAHLDFAYRLSQNFSTASFPTYCDGIKTKEDFETRALHSLEDPCSKILLFVVDGQLCGWIDYYWLERECYIGIHVFNVKDFQAQALEEFIQYANLHHPGYLMTLGFPVENRTSLDFLEKSGAKLVDQSDVYVLDLDSYQCLSYQGDIVEVNQANWQDFARLHDPHQEMYWNTDRLQEAINQQARKQWHIYLYYREGKAVAAIYFIYTPLLMEIFGVDYDQQIFDPMLFKNLVIKALNVAKLDQQRYLTYFADVQESPLLKAIGCHFVTSYMAYQIKMNLEQTIHQIDERLDK